jgi:hypothetical protein
MNRKRFEELSAPAQRAVREHSGKWIGDRYVSTVTRYEAEILRKLHGDPRRKVVNPPQAEIEQARGAFKIVIDEWTADNPRGRMLLTFAEAELARLRATR